MKTNRTELVWILDRSGSMRGLESDTIGGYNAMLEQQKREPGIATVTTVLFDDRFELLHDRVALQQVAPITDREYYVRGCTALLDAIGMTIRRIVNAQRTAAPELRADRVLFVITTDGHENASREYTYEQVRRMVQHEQEVYGWEFLFLGANIDAIRTAHSFGIPSDRSVNYHADPAGTRLNYEVVSDAVCSMRRGAPLDAMWKVRIEEDFRTRQSTRR